MGRSVRLGFKFWVGGFNLNFTGHGLSPTILLSPYTVKNGMDKGKLVLKGPFKELHMGDVHGMFRDASRAVPRGFGHGILTFRGSCEGPGRM